MTQQYPSINLAGVLLALMLVCRAHAETVIDMPPPPDAGTSFEAGQGTTETTDEPVTRPVADALRRYGNWRMRPHSRIPTSRVRPVRPANGWYGYGFGYGYGWYPWYGGGYPFYTYSFGINVKGTVPTVTRSGYRTTFSHTRRTTPVHHVH